MFSEFWSHPYRGQHLRMQQGEGVAPSQQPVNPTSQQPYRYSNETQNAHYTAQQPLQYQQGQQQRQQSVLPPHPNTGGIPQPYGQQPMGQFYHPYPAGNVPQYQQHHGVELATSGKEMKTGLKHLTSPTPAIDNLIFWPILFILVTPYSFPIYLLVDIFSIDDALLVHQFKNSN